MSRREHDNVYSGRRHPLCLSKKNKSERINPKSVDSLKDQAAALSRELGIRPTTSEKTQDTDSDNKN
jgi:hypothetical protein